MSHKPDDVVAKDSGTNFAPHSEGQFAMLCVDVVNLGMNVEQFQDKPAREVAKVSIVFASGERHEKMENGDQPLRLVVVEMALSAGEKANLRKLMQDWRGKTYTAEQIAAGLPITKLYGKPALVSVEHVLTRKGRQFAKIAGIAPLPKQVPPPDSSLLEEYVRPKFLEDKKAEYSARLTAHRLAKGAPVHGEEPPEPVYPGDEESEDLPF